MDLVGQGVDVRARGVVNGEIDLRVPILGGLGEITTTARIDAPVDFSASGTDGRGEVTVHATLQAPVGLKLALGEGRATVDAEIATNGTAKLKLGVPDRLADLAGEVSLKGQVRLAVPGPGGQSLDLPVSVEGTAGVSTTAPGAFCVDAHGTIGAPIRLQLTLPGGGGQVDVDIVANGKTDLRVALPSGHGQVQARGLAKGPIGLSVSLPGSQGYVRATGAIRAPVKLAAVLPEGRAKVGAEGIVDAQVEARAGLPRGRGWIEAQGRLKGPASLDVIAPDGRGELKAGAPIRTTVRLREIAVPNVDTPLDIDVDLNGAAELAMALPGRDGQLRLRLEAAIPLAPVFRLVLAEVERHVQVERMRLLPPRLEGEQDLTLPLYVEARKGVLAKVEVTTDLYIDPRTRQLVLWEIDAHGANAAGQAASRLYLNRKLFRPLRRTVLFDPATMLPPEATLHALCFRSASTEAIVLVADVTLAL